MKAWISTVVKIFLIKGIYSYLKAKIVKQLNMEKKKNLYKLILWPISINLNLWGKTTRLVWKEKILGEKNLSYSVHLTIKSNSTIQKMKIILKRNEKNGGGYNFTLLLIAANVNLFYKLQD